MRVKNQFRTSISGSHARVYNAENMTVRVSQARGRTAYPQGSIGADLLRRNYVRYLVERYNHFKHADSSFGSALKTLSKFSYAVIFKNVQSKFKAPTYFIPVERFDDLSDYLQTRIDQTILGKRNAARGQRNYETFDEYQLTQSAAESIR